MPCKQSYIFKDRNRAVEVTAQFLLLLSASYLLSYISDILHTLNLLPVIYPHSARISVIGYAIQILIILVIISGIVRHRQMEISPTGLTGLWLLLLSPIIIRTGNYAASLIFTPDFDAFSAYSITSIIIGQLSAAMQLCGLLLFALGARLSRALTIAIPGIFLMSWIIIPSIGILILYTASPSVYEAIMPYYTPVLLILYMSAVVIPLVISWKRRFA